METPALLPLWWWLFPQGRRSEVGVGVCTEEEEFFGGGYNSGEGGLTQTRGREQASINWLVMSTWEVPECLKWHMLWMNLKATQKGPQQEEVSTLYLFKKLQNLLDSWTICCIWKHIFVPFCCSLLLTLSQCFLTPEDGGIWNSLQILEKQHRERKWGRWQKTHRDNRGRDQDQESEGQKVKARVGKKRLRKKKREGEKCLGLPEPSDGPGSSPSAAITISLSWMAVTNHSPASTRQAACKNWGRWEGGDAEA